MLFPIDVSITVILNVWWLASNKIRKNTIWQPLYFYKNTNNKAGFGDPKVPKSGEPGGLKFDPFLVTKIFQFKDQVQTSNKNPLYYYGNKWIIFRPSPLTSFCGAN